MGVANWTTYGVNFVIAVLVARILGPEAFGLYAFAVAINEFVNIVNGLAVAPALVQSRQESDSLYDTGYAISFGQALLGLAVSLVLAPILAAHRSAEAAWFILILAAARFPLLMADVVVVRLDRRVRYGVISKIQVASRSLPNFVCLGLAWAGWGPWSLVLRDLLLGASLFGLAHLWSRYRFRGRVRRDAFRRIMSYSGPMFLARALDIFMHRLDRLVVGTALGNTAVGLYHQARFFADAGLLVSTPISQVTFNLYARLQDDAARLARSFGLVNYFLVRIFFAGATVLVVAPMETVRLLLGEEWLAVAPVLRILGIYAGLAPLLQNIQILLYARGVIFTGIRLRLLQLTFFLPGVVAAGWVGSLEGVAASLLVATGIAVALGWYFTRDVVRGTGRRIYAVPSIGLVLTVVLFWALRGATQDLPFWVMPFLPPLVFWASVALGERGRLLDEVRYLRGQLLRPDAERTPEGEKPERTA
jgi:O-antigen/teichoic acid export membrane protein